jgi:hypothetical protein
MSIQNGALVLIKIGNGATPEVFTTIGGLSTFSNCACQAAVRGVGRTVLLYEVMTSLC